MRYALIIAGGSGTRLWPMSRAAATASGGRPKQLLPFIGGKSLLQLSVDRLDGLIDSQNVLICAGATHCEVILAELQGVSAQRLYVEPMGRDTLNAVGFVTAERLHADPDAVIAVFTADHVIQPVNEFQKIVARGFDIAESQADTLVTFGIEPTQPATGYGYLQLGDAPGDDQSGERVVDQFKEKPPLELARQYVAAGPQRYLWNSGMFVWRASTMMACIKKFAPENYVGLQRIAQAYATPQRDAVIDEVYPTLKRISVDFAVMEPASNDEQFNVVAVPMPLQWLDVGSWPAFAQTLQNDNDGNALGAGQHVLIDSKNNLLASSDPKHVISMIGCNDLIVIHTPDATLVCHKDEAERIKQMHEKVQKTLGDEYV